jgi:hypothetical protein
LLTESLLRFQRILVARETPSENARKTGQDALSFRVEKTVRRFAKFAEAEKADRDFYKKLTGNQRVQICVDLSTLDPDQPLERVYRIRKLSALDAENP